jgi:hypothetical protein
LVQASYAENSKDARRMPYATVRIVLINPAVEIPVRAVLNICSNRNIFLSS